MVSCLGHRRTGGARAREPSVVHLIRPRVGAFASLKKQGTCPPTRQACEPRPERWLGPPTPSVREVLVARELTVALRKEEYTMKGPFMIVGLALIILGVIAFAYQGITYTTREKVLEVGPITATKETKRTIPLPPVLGGIALAGVWRSCWCRRAGRAWAPGCPARRDMLLGAPVFRCSLAREPQTPAGSFRGRSSRWPSPGWRGFCWSLSS